MRKLVDPADLVGAKEAAERAGVSKAAISNWSARFDDFPKPIVELACARIYLWSEINAWLDREHPVVRGPYVRRSGPVKGSTYTRKSHRRSTHERDVSI